MKDLSIGLNQQLEKNYSQIIDNKIRFSLGGKYYARYERKGKRIHN